jgi:short-subunit dehydrogenase
MDIQDKVTIITGASEGIGLAIARDMAKEGAKLVLAARSADKLEAIVKDMPGLSDEALAKSEALAVPTDMTKPADIQNLFDKTMEKFGRVDILINNAGQGLYSKFEDIKLEDYRAIMELNIFAVVEAMQMAIPIMRKQGGGLILNISSRVSQNYYQNLSAYASTKYALNALSLTARAELEPDNIKVAIFMPKMTATQFGQNSKGQHPDFSAGVPPRPGMVVDTPEQVAEKVVEQIKADTAEESM